MESQELIDAFRQQLDQVEANGGSQLQVSGVRAYLYVLERDSGESKELRKLKHEGMLAHYSATTSHSIEMLKAVIEAGQSALQSLIVINGGAVIALLSVMSSLVGKQGGTQLARYLALPLLEFGVAVLCGALGFAFRYLSQACYGEATVDDASEKKFKPWGDGIRNAAILSAFAGYVLFGFAITNSYLAVVWTF